MSSDAKPTSLTAVQVILNALLETYFKQHNTLAVASNGALIELTYARFTSSNTFLFATEKLEPREVCVVNITSRYVSGIKEFTLELFKVYEPFLSETVFITLVEKDLKPTAIPLELNGTITGISTDSKELTEVKPNKKHSHYFKEVSHLKVVDVYRVCDLFGVTDSAISHAIKKLLVSGKRGVKDQAQDIQEAIDTLQRKLEMLKEDSDDIQ